jgi:hypothetical protein
MDEKITMFRISPELNDGDHYGICKDIKQLEIAVRQWAEMALNDPECECSIKAVEMTQAEYDAIPVY